MPIHVQAACYQQGYSVFVWKEYGVFLFVGHYGFVDSAPSFDYSFVINEGTERLKFTLL